MTSTPPRGVCRECGQAYHGWALEHGDKMLIRELLIELQDRYQQTRCGCGHPYCKQCRDDQITRSVLVDARAKLKEESNASQN